jgi:bifunctional non-homologous end joining protein LigD
VPLIRTQEVVVVGWKAGGGRRTGTIGSLLLAVHDDADRTASAARRQPAPAVPASSGQVEGAFETPDGRWRVEVVRRGRDRFYRLLHGGNVIDGLFIASVQRLLAEDGIDLADLIEANADSFDGHSEQGVA